MPHRCSWLGLTIAEELQNARKRMKLVDSAWTAAVVVSSRNDVPRELEMSKLEKPELKMSKRETTSFGEPATMSLGEQMATRLGEQATNLSCLTRSPTHSLLLP